MHAKNSPGWVCKCVLLATSAFQEHKLRKAVSRSGRQNGPRRKSGGLEYLEAISDMHLYMQSDAKAHPCRSESSCITAQVDLCAVKSPPPLSNGEDVCIVDQLPLVDGSGLETTNELAGIQAQDQCSACERSARRKRRKWNLRSTLERVLGAQEHRGVLKKRRVFLGMCV